MKTSVFLCALSAALPVLAGSGSGGSGAGAVLISADTVSTAGGTSTAGSGSGAVTNLSSIGGIPGTVSTAIPPALIRQGWIPQTLGSPLAGYELWASQNIPAGKPAAFDADADRDGIPNGVKYALGNTALSFDAGLQRFRIGYPAAIPSDVNLFLERSLTLSAGSWQPIVSWVNGASPTPAAGIQLQALAQDPLPATGPRAYYRYRAVKR